MRRVLRSLFIKDIEQRHQIVNVNFCLDEITLSSCDRMQLRCDYKMKICIDTKDEKSAIRVQTIEGLNEEEKLESMSRWIEIMSNEKQE